MKFRTIADARAYREGFEAHDTSKETGFILSNPYVGTSIQTSDYELAQWWYRGWRAANVK